MSKWNRHKGDVADYVDVRIDGVLDLTLVTAVSGSVTYGSAGTPQALTATVLNPLTRIVRVSLSPWLATATIGCWRLATHLTFSGPVGALTWPEDGFDEIEVGPAG